ncbi:hypothetical protein, partial [Sedimenticola sp.]|uniref:hypothetical protein n=1 Tax=Sedimenticola sp. TaxID=1940285 RepID=UPI0025828116
ITAHSGSYCTQYNNLFHRAHVRFPYVIQEEINRYHASGSNRRTLDIMPSLTTLEEPKRLMQAGLTGAYIDTGE